ncbi:MAG TPA: response regulator [Terriglobales bacterium]|nr:response regulator [Terriglobales bacterium]
MPKQANIAVVDDDESVRESLPDLLNMLGFTARTFASPEEFLESDFFRQTDCLILDVAMRGMSGPQLQTELKRLGSKIPIIFITAQPNGQRQRLVEQGAVDCLLKPFSDTALREALNRALRLSDGCPEADPPLERNQSPDGCGQQILRIEDNNSRGKSVLQKTTDGAVHLS